MLTDEELAAIRARADAASDGPWFYNGYSAVFSSPKTRPYDAWFDTIPEGHTVERYGDCPVCGEWQVYPCGVAPSPGVGHGCKFFTEDYRRDPLVAKVPSHHGDTAVEKRAADAEFIAAARADVPALCAEVDRLTAELARLADAVLALPGEPATEGSAVDVAIRILERLRAETASEAPASPPANRLRPVFDRGAEEVMAALAGQGHAALDEAIAFNRETFKARFGCYPEECTVVEWGSPCRHCGDHTDIDDDPLPDLCAMCAKAGRT